ncbi:MAG: radical SAM protein, partial [Ruminococcus sp.]|nr:radical SAM protein [Ruminococcus sp.]
IALIKRLREEFEPGQILVSLMSQYTPVYKAHEHREIDRRLSTFEYRSVLEALEESGFDGYTQQKTSASEEFIPQFFDEKYY